MRQPNIVEIRAIHSLFAYFGYRPNLEAFRASSLDVAMTADASNAA
jgi:hypothetical protein